MCCSSPQGWRLEEGREEGAGVEGSSVCRQSVAADMEQVTETSTRREHATLRERAYKVWNSADACLFSVVETKYKPPATCTCTVFVFVVFVLEGVRNVIDITSTSFVNDTSQAVWVSAKKASVCRVTSALSRKMWPHQPPLGSTASLSLVGSVYAPSARRRATKASAHARGTCVRRAQVGRGVGHLALHLAPPSAEGFPRSRLKPLGQPGKGVKRLRESLVS